MADVRTGLENGPNGAKKRRETGSAGASSPLKKIKMEDDEPPVADPNTIEAVREKNRAMAVDLLDKNRRIAFLTGKCEALFQRSAVAGSAFRCIQRQWGQLLDDACSLTAVVHGGRAEGDEASDVPAAALWKEAEKGVASLDAIRVSAGTVKLEMPEWFLAINRRDRGKDTDTDTSRNGTRMNEDTGALGDAGEDTAAAIGLTKQQEEWVARLKQEHERGKQVLQRLVEEVAQAKRGDQTQRHEQPVAWQQLVREKQEAAAIARGLKDELEAYKEKLADLQNDLEEKEVERHRACRDYDRLSLFLERQGELSTDGQQDGDGPVISSNHQQQSQASQLQTQLDNTASQQGAENKPAVSEEIEGTSADKEMERKLRADLLIFSQKLQTERRANETLRRERDRLQAVETAWQKEAAHRQQEHAATIARMQEENGHITEEFAKLRHKAKDMEQHVHDKWKKRLAKMQADVLKAKTQVDDITVKNAGLREKLSGYSVFRDQLADFKSENESLKRENAAIKERFERAGSRNERLQHSANHQEIVRLQALLDTANAQRTELQSRVDEMQPAQLPSGDAQLDSILDREKALLAKYSDLQTEHTQSKATVATMRHQLENLQQDQEAFKLENDALIAEIEVMTKEMESVRHSKKKVLHQLEEKRNATKKLQTQVAKESDAKAHCFEELAAARLLVSSVTHVHKQQKATLDAANESLKARDDQLANLKNYVEQLESERDTVTDEKMKAQHAADVVQKLYDAETAQKEQQLLHEKKRPCERCDSFRKREAEYEKKLAAAKVAASSSGSSGGGGGLNDLERLELRDLQKQLKCSVCQDGHKNVIISKCFHMFCRDCIDSNLKSRNRKCPTCKKMYGQDDVKSVWLA